MIDLYAFYQTYAATLTFTALVAAGVLVAWNLALTMRLRTMQARYRAALGGDTDLDVEKMLGDVHAQSRHSNERLDAVERSLADLRTELTGRAGRVGVVRFNPFAESGGNQSFALAIVDDAGTGVVVSSLHNRDATRVYAKPLDRGTSTYQLTDEEREAIELALKR